MMVLEGVERRARPSSRYKGDVTFSALSGSGKLDWHRDSAESRHDVCTQSPAVSSIQHVGALPACIDVSLLHCYCARHMTGC